MILLPSDIALQPVEVADTGLLHTIAVQAYRDHYADTWYDGGIGYMQTFLSIDQLQHELREPEAQFFFILYQAAVVGFLKLNWNKAVAGYDEEALELERIYLKKETSGQGIGTIVLRWVFAQAINKSIEMVWLKVMDTNPDAVRFYERMGFSISGTHQVDFVQNKEGMRGMYVMCKCLYPGKQ